MSDMEAFYGTFRRSDHDIVPSDEDEFYDYEEDTGLLFVTVDGNLYEIENLDPNIDECNLTMIIEPSDKVRFMAHFYNGGAEVHEVIESLIGNYLKSSKGKS
tara:strand:- start:2500 stop:2805 length:306 start_codon:yes stop_codon:yes gene_type:complete